MPPMRPSRGKKHSAVSRAGKTQRGAKHIKKTSTSAHRQLQLLHKSIKKAKQFELRKLIRRLKSAAEGTSASSAQASLPSLAKLQAQYDATKALNTETALRQDPNPLSKQPIGLDNRFGELVVTRLLSANCVRQQVDSIKQQQQQASVDAAAGTIHVARNANTRAMDHETNTHSNVAEDHSDSASAQSTSSQDRSILQDVHDQAGKGSEEDQLIANAVMARVLQERANNEEHISLATNSSSQFSQADAVGEDSADSAAAMQAVRAQQSSEADAVDVARADSADALQAAAAHRQDQSGAGALVAPKQHQQKRSLHDMSADAEHRSNRYKSWAAVKPNKQPQAVPKKKKNRLGQRARQQLGRAKQGQQLGLAKQEQQVAWQPKSTGLKSNPRTAPPAASLGHKDASYQFAKRPKTEHPSGSEHMHPSWQAKQKQKQAMLTAAPTGSKTVFAEDGETVSKAVPASKAVSAANMKTAPAGAKRVAAEKLHPSWDAKRSAALRQAELASQKPASKIVFAD